MKKNLDTKSRAIRILAGIVIIGLGVYFRNWLGALGLLPVLGGLTGNCPLCCLFSKGSCEIKKDAPKEDPGGKKDGCCGHQH